MQYFFLEKQSPLTQRWKVRQIAFDARYRYLYYSAPVSQSELEAAAQAAALAELSGRDEEHAPTVTWRRKLKLTALTYMADEYAVPPTSADFQEKLLLTLTVTGYERKLDKAGAAARKQKRAQATSGKGSGARPAGSMTVASAAAGERPSMTGGGDYTGRGSLSYTAHSSPRRSDVGSPIGPRPTTHTNSTSISGTATGTGTAGEVSHMESEAPPPELPSMELHLEGYDAGAFANAEDVEDADENLFRDIELVPDSNPDDLDADDDDNEEDEEEEEEEVLNSPTTRALSEAASEERTVSFYSFASTRSAAVKKVSVVFRARNYDAFRVVSLRLRQALVRHGLCAPLHHGLPPYDPRNGIAFATVPLHLRYQFRRLNDVVFYSFQHGHAVYVRHLREVRGLSGYLCITHDSVLLLQADGKCPRWVDLEDIVGIDYVLKGSQSFVSILAAAPLPDFLFIPIFPIYPLISSFDAELAVEGVVGMLRRLLMQRLRADEDVSLEPLPKHEDLDADNASDVDDYDALCHIRDLSGRYDDVFRYISQNGPGRPLRWRWDNSKTPKHFTYKKDLAAALKRDEDSAEGEGDRSAAASDDDDDDDDANVDAPHRESLLPAHRVATRPPPARGLARARAESFNASIMSAASFTTATVAQLLAPPSSAAELRARERLRVTRTDPKRRERLRALSPPTSDTTAPPTSAAVLMAPITVAAVAAVAAGVVPPVGPLPSPAAGGGGSAKPESYGLVRAPALGEGVRAGEGEASVVPALRGTRLPADAPAVTAQAPPPPPPPPPPPTVPLSPVGVGAGKGPVRVAVPASGGGTSTVVRAVRGKGSGRGPRRRHRGGGRGKHAHRDPVVGSAAAGAAVAAGPSGDTTALRGAGEESDPSGGDDDDHDDEDEVWGSEDVDDLLEEPLAGALQTPRRRASGSGLAHRGPAMAGDGSDSEEASDSEGDASPMPSGVGGSSTQLSMGSAPALARPAGVPVEWAEAGRALHKAVPQRHVTPAAPMPAPTVQANTKLATDFLVTVPSTGGEQSMSPLLPPAKPE